MLSIPDPRSGRFDPRSTKIGELRRDFPRAPPREKNPGELHRRRAAKPSWPPDLESAATIRSKPIKSEPPDPDPSAQI